MLKKLFTAALWMLLAFPVGNALAQQTGTITGTVVDSVSTEPLPGVNVVVQGLSIGAATDANGEFRITDVPVGEQTLVASFIGYETNQVPIVVSEGTNEVTIRMTAQLVGLEDVVVTALGVERAQRSIGYAVAEVEGEELAQVPETNFINSLAGQVPGANIYSSNAMGGSARIVLRGPNSIGSNNQPLIVVDGVPLDNSTFTDLGQAYGGGGFDFGNAASIVNPANIQSVSILKGGAAAALYGSRGANGVIQITTKSGVGQEGIGVTINTSLMMQEVYGLPDYQDQYGGGPPAAFATTDLGEPRVRYAVDQSWGPRLDGRLVRQWYSWSDADGLMGLSTPWVAHPDNIANFYRTGLTSNTTVAFSQGADNYNYRLSLANVGIRGNAPNASSERRSLSFKGGLDLTDNLQTTVVANYVNNSVNGLPITGYSGINVQFNHFGQRQVALGENSYMRNYRRANGLHRGWNWSGLTAAKLGGGANLIYANNPYWDRFENYANNNVERVYGSVGVSYDLTDALSLVGEAGTDYYLERRQLRTAVGSASGGVIGDYTENIFEVQETSADLRLNYDQQLSSDWSLSAFGATEYRYESYSNNFGSAEGGLSAAEVYTLENSVGRQEINDYYEQKGVFSLYGSATIGFRDIVYLDLTARNDWSSTLPDDANSYFYPSVATSFVFSALPALQSADVLSFGKLRASWARVGTDTDPYRLALTYPLETPFAGSPVQTLPTTLPNAELLPEITSTWEVGTTLQFFNNRLGLDATYYHESTRNQIIDVDVSGATGFGGLVVNAGEITNQGVELGLTGTPVFTESFQWDVYVNFAKNVNEVVSLQGDLQAYNIGPSVFGPDVQARVGEPFGTFFGTDFVYDANGNKVIAPSGLYEASDPTVLGTYLPDWTGGFGSTFSYGGFFASISFNGQKGGEIYSLSNTWGHYSGMFGTTADGDVREVGVIPVGAVWFPQNYDSNDANDVTDPSQAVGEPFTGQIGANRYFSNWYFGPKALVMYDASFLKLREVSLGYTLPAQWLEGTFIQRLTVSLIGSNLAVLFKNTPNFDPSVALSARNLQGIEAGPIPPKRSYGFSLRMQL